MTLFSRKTKTDAAEYAKSFYDRFIFGPDPTGGDFAEVYADVTRRSIAEAAPSFAAVSLPRLKEELLALRLEMIGTAWTHESKVEAALAASEATKTYLSASERLDPWEAMADYSSAVGQSATYGADPETGTGRARIVMINKMRMDFWNQWSEGRDHDAVARVANRIGSEASRKSGAMQGILAVQVTRRLGIEDSDPISERLAAVAHGFYQGAKEELSGVQLMP
jgi:hypothetical protein